MAKYTLLFDDVWIKQLKKLDLTTKKNISKVLDKLEERPEDVGKPLRYSGGKLREVRIGKYRLYYTIVRNVIKVLNLVLILELSHKDEQIKTLQKLTQKIDDKIDTASKKLEGSDT